MSPLHATSRKVLLGGTPRGRLLPPAVSRDTHSPIPDLGSAGMEHHSPCAPIQPLPRPPRRAGKSSSFHTAKTSFFLLEPPPHPSPYCRAHPSATLPSRSQLSRALSSPGSTTSAPQLPYLEGGSIPPLISVALQRLHISPALRTPPLDTALRLRHLSTGTPPPTPHRRVAAVGLGAAGVIQARGGGDHHHPTHPTDPGLRCSPRGSTLVKTTAAAYTTLPGGSIHTAPVGAGDSRRPQSMDRALSGLRVATSSTEGAPMVLHT